MFCVGSRVTCSNCGENGHTKVRCKKETVSPDTIDGGGFESFSAGPVDSSGWDDGNATGPVDSSAWSGGNAGAGNELW